MARRRSKVTEAEKKASVPNAGKHSFLDIHRALFPNPPEPRTLDELKQGIEDYIREKHARR